MDEFQIDLNEENVRKLFFGFVQKNGKLSFRAFEDYLYKDFH
jgi:hypothetical protein